MAKLKPNIFVWLFLDRTEKHSTMDGLWMLTEETLEI
jgi:hypothetical protein